jgi:hypothetical protein
MTAQNLLQFRWRHLLMRTTQMKSCTGRLLDYKGVGRS